MSLKPPDADKGKCYELPHITNAKINYSKRDKTELISTLPNVVSVFFKINYH